MSLSPISPSDRSEVFVWLRTRGVYFVASEPLSGRPDLFLLDAPPKLEWAHGAALELKRASSHESAAKQKLRLAQAKERGFAASAFKSAADAIAWLISLGYDRGGVYDGAGPTEQG